MTESISTDLLVLQRIAMGMMDIRLAVHVVDDGSSSWIHIGMLKRAHEPLSYMEPESIPQLHDAKSTPLDPNANTIPISKIRVCKHIKGKKQEVAALQA